MTIDGYLKHQQVLIKGQEEKGVFFVRDIVFGLTEHNAELISVDSPQKILEIVPITQLVRIFPKERDILDFFTKIVVQRLKKNIGKSTQPVFHCNTIFKPYQFRPLLKFLKSNDGRLLIADEAGLGKTIEAGYILINQIYTKNINRVLILCPSSVQFKWKSELWYRFGLSFDIINGRKLIDFLMNPKLNFNFIISMDCFRGLDKKILNFPIDSKIDLLIIDEIHHMIGRSGDTLRRTIGITLSTMAKNVIGLSATPVQIEILDFKKLLDVIHPGLKSLEQFNEEIVINSYLNKLFLLLSKDSWESMELEMFLNCINDFKKNLNNISTIDNRKCLLEFIEQINEKIEPEFLSDKKSRYDLRKKVILNNSFSDFYIKTKRKNVGEIRTRNVRNEKIRLESTIRKVYQNGRMVESCEKLLFGEIDSFLKDNFHNIHRRQLASCLPAMINLLRGGMKGFNVWVNDDWKEIETSLNETQKDYCLSLVNKFSLLKKDTKWETLIRIIKDLHEKEEIKKAIVFTQWIPTINYFRDQKNFLDFPCYLISGKDNEFYRNKQIREFRKNDGFAMLFTTDVLSEGLDLQSADCVINYDLPYNPQKIEQRIGRIDRIGQESQTITIINMLVEDSTDESVFELLLTRINAFEESFGDFPKTLIEKVEDEGAIDDDEVIRFLSERNLRNELLENDSLQIFDEFLDSEIKKQYSKYQQTSYALRWMAFERLFFMVFGRRNMQHVAGQKDFIKIPFFSEEDVETIANLVTIKEKASVTDEILNNIDQEGALIVSFNVEKNGFYLPFFHPLMKKAVEISYASFFPDNEQQPEPSILTISRNDDRSKSEKKMLVIIENSFQGKTEQKSEWVWYSINENNEIITLQHSPLEELWEKLTSEKFEAQSVADKFTLSQPIWNRIFDQRTKWYNAAKDEDEKSYFQIKRTEMQILKEKKKRLTKKLEKCSNSLLAQTIKHTIEEIENKLNEIHKLFIETKLNDHCIYTEKSITSRVVGVIIFGGKNKSQ